MIVHVQVGSAPGFDDVASREALAELRQAAPTIEKVRAWKAYELDLPDSALSILRSEGLKLLADQVCEEARTLEGGGVEVSPSTVFVFKKPGVMDPIEQSARQAFAEIGIELRGFRAGLRLDLEGGPRGDELRTAIYRTLANPVVDDVWIGAFPPLRLPVRQVTGEEPTAVPIRFAGDDELVRISRIRGLSLNLAEMRVIRDKFLEYGREPHPCELETIAQTWSEHCKHKTFRSPVDLEWEPIRGSRAVIRFDDLLRDTVFRATRDIQHPFCLSVFRDNAGVVRFDETTAVCFKVETHNHPSAIEPYGGASTGLGGVIRDILGCGRGGKPIASVDVFAVGPPESNGGRIPPARMLRSVVAGVRDYGNRMGIPTVAGAVVFDEGFARTPLVFCGTVGCLPLDRVSKEARAGDRIVLIGGRTGRDGIHGATFSSTHLDEDSEEADRGAVQIGNPIEEKKVMDAVLEAREEDLFDAITDCGAGGLSSAIGEMGAEIGADVDLDPVPLKYEGLSGTEIWISEAQERMVLAVPPEKLSRFREVCRRHQVEICELGKFVATGRLVVRHRGRTLCDLEMGFLHGGVPLPRRKAYWRQPEISEPDLQVHGRLDEDLLRLLADPNVASKEWIIRQYDHEVQANTVIKPLVGPGRDGPGDGAVVRLRPESHRALAIGLGICPRISAIDPYAMAALAIDEAVRNVLAVGGDPSQTALLDNFCWSSPDDPEVMGALVLAAMACRDVARSYGMPFISGKDSLHNEFREGDRVTRIPHTLLISALSIVPDFRRCVTSDLKAVGNSLYLLGETRAELGGSLFYRSRGHLGASVPALPTAPSRKTYQRLFEAMERGLVRSCHDVSDGGLAVAVAEMAIGGGLGVEVCLDQVVTPRPLPDWQVAFSESPARFVVEIERAREEDFLSVMHDVRASRIGRVTGTGEIVFRSRDAIRVKLPVDQARRAWQGTFAGWGGTP